MNEQRLQAYYQLIQQLLSCPHGEEAAILQANRELLDVGFLQMVVEVAGTFTQQGEENTANWLLALASQLSEELDIPLEENTPETETPLTEADIETYLPFLLQVLQATSDSEGNPQVVYPLLAANTDKLNLTFAKLLQAWATKTLEAEPHTAEDIAIAIGNFSNLIQEFPSDNKTSDIEIAITGYEIALTIFTRADFPQDWASTYNNLGTAYSDRIKGDPSENFKKALDAFSAALQIYTCDHFPENYAEALTNLGILYQNSKQFPLAKSTFASAIETVENLRNDIISGEESKRKFAEKWNLLFRRMVEVCLVLGQETKAIEYIERSKTRNLVELISANRKFTPIQYTEIQNLLDNETAIIQFYIFNDCFRAFIITRNNPKPVIWKSPDQDLTDLKKWIYQYIENYVKNKDNWGLSLSNKLTELANILHLPEIITLIPTQYQKLIIIPHRYLHIVPFHAVPLSVNNEDSEYLFARFTDGVSYAPSCQLLKFAQKPLPNSLLPQTRIRLSNLFAIQNPSNDLPYTNIEVETIANKFQPQQTLKHRKATKSALLEQPIKDTFLNSQWLHFSCHGYFKFDEPLKSGLQLAGAEVSNNNVNIHSSGYLRVNEQTTLDLTQCLTLEEIFELNLAQCYLVCLSACETGLTDLLNTSDEYISLSSGFIKAGASNIVSSLWAISDFHTALLMIKFYENLENDVQNVVLSLNHAQKWLNQATQQQIVKWIDQQHQMEEEAKQEI